jgi:RND family efflux transporter MFP subunit
MNNRQKLLAPVAATAIAGLLILGVGFGAFKFFSSMRKPPSQVAMEERALAVEAWAAAPRDVVVEITGTGLVRPLDSVAIAPEVAGMVVELHPRLDLGEVIPEGELLFRVDPRDYEARVQEARAQVASLRNAVERLEKQYQIDQERLQTLERSRVLAEGEFTRIKELFEKDEVGTRSGVDQAERAYNAAADQADQLKQAVTLYPIRVQETRSGLAAAEAQLGLHETNLARTEIRAPFNGRVQMTSVKAGEYVTPGVPLITLADDRVLEISVPLDSREARRWLLFEDDHKAAATTGWFNTLKRVPVDIHWTEDTANHLWKGTLYRVDAFNEATRTLTVAVRIEGEQAFAQQNGGFPLVEGMFCTVSIPGKKLEGVFEVPSSVVDFEGNVYLAVDGRLRTQPVTVAYATGDKSYITAGLTKGDMVITTRLVNPLENTLLTVVAAQEQMAAIP